MKKASSSLRRTSTLSKGTATTQTWTVKMTPMTIAREESLEDLKLLLDPELTTKVTGVKKKYSYYFKLIMVLGSLTCRCSQASWRQELEEDR